MMPLLLKTAPLAGRAPHRPINAPLEPVVAPSCLLTCHL